MSADDPRTAIIGTEIGERIMIEFWPLRSQTTVTPAEVGGRARTHASRMRVAGVGTPAGSRRRSEWVIIGGLALAVLALHLAWGFVDYPPLTPAIARLSELIFGTNVWGLRLWPSLAGALLVVLAAQIAHELGGGRNARILAAIGAAASPVLLGANWLFETVTFDQVTWLVCLWLTARLL